MEDIKQEDVKQTDNAKMGGKSEVTPTPPKKPLTPKEYADLVLRGTIPSKD